MSTIGLMVAGWMIGNALAFLIGVIALLMLKCVGDRADEHSSY